jgi:O-antigen ligase
LTGESVPASLARGRDAAAPRRPLAGVPAARRWLVLLLTIGLAASISLSEVVFAVLALLAVLAPVSGARRVIWPLVLPIGAFAVWSIIAALASARPGESLYSAKTLIWLGVIYVMIHALPDREAARRFVDALFMATSVVALFAIVQVALCPFVHETTGVVGWFFHKCGRARGFFSIYMTLAGVLTLVTLSVLPRIRVGNGASIARLAFWIAAVIALGLTFVRGAWVGFAVAIVGSHVAMRRRATLWLGVIGLVLVIAAAAPWVLEYFRTTGKQIVDDRTRDRIAMAEAGWLMLREHPITGVGVGQVKRLYPTYATPDALRHSTSHLHNTPLQILVERGVVGLTLWLSIYVAFFARARRILRRLPASEDRDLVLGSVTAVAAFLIAGLFEYNFGDTEVLFVANALMAVPFIIERDLT